MHRLVRWGVAALLLSTLAACAAGSPAAAHAADEGFVSALVLGLWHGLIAPVTLIVEVIRTLAPGALPWAWRLYEASHPSLAYDIGFYFGLAGGPSFLIWRR